MHSENGLQETGARSQRSGEEPVQIPISNLLRRDNLLSELFVTQLTRNRRLEVLQISSPEGQSKMLMTRGKG